MKMLSEKWIIIGSESFSANERVELKTHQSFARASLSLLFLS